MSSHSSVVAQAFASLLETEKDWEKRVKGMQQFEDKLKTDASIEFSVQDILLFRSHLAAQIQDNRTTVTKQACELIVTLSETQSAGFAPHTQVFFHSLLKQSYVTVKVASDAAHTTLCLILRISALPASKMFLEINKGLKDAHNSILRRRCALYLLILVKFRMNAMKSLLDNISPLVVALLRDSSSTTRSRARAVYYHILQLSQPHAKQILQEVDAKVRNTLSEELSQMENIDTEGFEPTPPTTTSNSRIGSRAASRTTSRTTSRSGSPERKGSSSNLRSSALSPSSSSNSSASIDLMNLEKKLANLSRETAIGSNSVSKPPIYSKSTSNSPASKSSLLATSTTPKSKVSTTSSSTKTTSSASKAPVSKDKVSTSKIPSSASKSTIAAPNSKSMTTTNPQKRSVTVNAVTASSHARILSNGSSSNSAAIQRTASRDSLFSQDGDSSSVVNVEFDDSLSVGEEAVSNGNGRLDLPYIGDWKTALEDLRQLMRRTREVLEADGVLVNEDPERTELVNIDFSSPSSTQTDEIISKKSTSSQSNNVTSPRSSNPSSTSQSKIVSKIPLSPRNLQAQLDAVAASAAAAYCSNLEEEEFLEVEEDPLQEQVEEEILEEDFEQINPDEESVVI